MYQQQCGFGVVGLWVGLGLMVFDQDVFVVVLVQYWQLCGLGQVIGVGGQQGYECVVCQQLVQLDQVGFSEGGWDEYGGLGVGVEVLYYLVVQVGVVGGLWWCYFVQ